MNLDLTVPQTAETNRQEFPESNRQEFPEPTGGWLVEANLGVLQAVEPNAELETVDLLDRDRESMRELAHRAARHACGSAVGETRHVGKPNSL